MALSAERMEDFSECFAVVGKNEDGVDKETLGIIMRSMGQDPSNAEVDELFGKVSANGKVNKDGVLKAAAEFESKKDRSAQLAQMKEAFAVFDKDNSGSISSAYVLP
jgi:calmodulin